MAIGALEAHPHADWILAPTDVADLQRDMPVVAETLTWVREFLGRPHRDVGRPGPVCPFVPHALRRDAIWMKVIHTSQPTVADVQAVVRRYRDVFIELEPTDEQTRIDKALLLIFPDVPAADAPALIDGVKDHLKGYFVESGLMLGEFHSLNPAEGLHNPAFRPLRSPVPMLAIRYMVESDLPFLMRLSDSPAKRAAYLRAYLEHFGTVLDERWRRSATEALETARRVS